MVKSISSMLAVCRSWLRAVELTPMPLSNPWAARPEAVRALLRMAEDHRKVITNVTMFESSIDIDSGYIAAVVTHLQLLELMPREIQGIPGYRLSRVERPSIIWYRALYRSIGEDWLWFSRLAMSDADLEQVLSHPNTLVFALECCGQVNGLLEMNCRNLPDAEISFLGVIKGLVGSGAGTYLLERAIAIAADYAASRLTVHTCTLDHPSALAFYVKRGFKAYKRSIEISPDPRITGVLPTNAGPHCPIIL